MPAVGRVSVLIPSRNERFLVPTVRDVLAKSRGDCECVVILDGYWPGANETEPLPPDLLNDTRIKFLHRGTAQGMRPAINAAVQMATGEFLFKCDAHVMLDEGWDLKLKADYHESNWILIPRRYALDPIKWEIDHSNGKYPIDAHRLVEPFHAYGDSTPGLHGTFWSERKHARKHIEIDDEMSSQGSAWFMSRTHWDWLGPMSIQHYGSFWHEIQELGLKTWLGGGALKITKRTWYAHLYKGQRFGRGYSTRGMGHEEGTAFCSWFFMTDQPFPGKCRTMRWFIEQFMPVPTWDDLDAIFARAQKELQNPYERVAA